MGMDTWPLDYSNPVELNRYVYAAGNPATYVDPSGYSIFGYTKNAWNSAVNIGKAAIGHARYDFIGGALSGAAGYLGGVVALSLLEDHLSDDIDFGESFADNFDGTDLVLNMLAGGFVGVINKMNLLEAQELLNERISKEIVDFDLQTKSLEVGLYWFLGVGTSSSLLSLADVSESAFLEVLSDVVLSTLGGSTVGLTNSWSTRDVKLGKIGLSVEVMIGIAVNTVVLGTDKLFAY
jgi:hypothetical protein